MDLMENVLAVQPQDALPRSQLGCKQQLQAEVVHMEAGHITTGSQASLQQGSCSCRIGIDLPLPAGHLGP